VDGDVKPRIANQARTHQLTKARLRQLATACDGLRRLATACDGLRRLATADRDASICVLDLIVFRVLSLDTKYESRENC
jgi:hypothetical protein